MNKKISLLILILFLSVAYSLTSFAQDRTMGHFGKDRKVTRPAGGKNMPESGGVAKPEGALGTPKVYRGSASLVFFYFGDSPFETFFQESMELYRAMKNYKKVVLLKEETPHGMKVSQRALNKADKVAMPTRENIIKYLKELTKEGYFIDVWIFSHGSSGGFRVYDSTQANKNGRFSTSDIQSLPESTGYKYIPIRMVFQVNCYGYDLIDDWRKIGAKTALGSRQVSFYPYEFSRFASQWNKGKTFKEARDKADSITPHQPVYTYVSTIMAPEAKRDGKWDGCPLGYNVLGTSNKALECGRDFFSTKSIWADKLLTWRGNGKSTMDYSNFKIAAGDYNITKNTVPKW